MEHTEGQENGHGKKGCWLGYLEAKEIFDVVPLTPFRHDNHQVYFFIIMKQTAIIGEVAECTAKCTFSETPYRGKPFRACVLISALVRRHNCNFHRAGHHAVGNPKGVDPYSCNSYLNNGFFQYRAPSTFIPRHALFCGLPSTEAHHFL